MGWEEDYRKERECPCGRGKYLEVHYSDDFNRARTDMIMLCGSCRGKYVYDFSLDKSFHPRDEVERGWVLREDFDRQEREKGAGDKGIKKVKKAKKK